MITLRPLLNNITCFIRYLTVYKYVPSSSIEDNTHRDVAKNENRPVIRSLRKSIISVNNAQAAILTTNKRFFFFLNTFFIDKIMSGRQATGENKWLFSKHSQTTK